MRKRLHNSPRCGSKRLYRVAYLHLLAATLTAASSQSLPNPPTSSCHSSVAESPALSKRVLQLLGSGQLVVVMRHANAPGVSAAHTGLPRDCINPDLVMSKDCEGPERPVSGEGECQLDQIRLALADIHATFQEIRHSQYCRTEQTATALSGNSRVVADSELNRNRARNYLTSTISRSDLGGNVLLVTHSEDIQRLISARQNSTNTPEVSDAIAFVFDTSLPATSPEDRCLGYLRPADWEALVGVQRSIGAWLARPASADHP